MPTAGSGGSGGRVLKRADPRTIQDKFLVGYQGWFTCGGDGPPIGEGHHGWLHWVDQPIPANGRPNTDLWPDVSAYEPSELYPVPGLALKDGAPAKVFSSRDPRTVRRHFRWMAEHGVDGAFLQRFVSQVDPEEAGNQDERFGGTRRLRDEVGERVREAAEAEGRVWAIMYDVSGVPASQIQRIVTRDFTHLLRDLRIFSSPAYLRERGKPVVALWGFGLSDSSVSPHTARTVFESVRAVARAVGGEQDVYIFAGVPSHWRTPGTGDAHADPAWEGLWLGETGAVDALSPWSVGRYSTAADVERWAEERWGGDADLIAQHNENLELSGAGRGRKVDYMPVILPGGSGFNLSQGKWSFNGIKRNGGKFLWSQIFHAKRLKGVRSFYGAMWDEYDEGTAFLPVVERKRQLPESDRWPFLALDEDGFDLPSDWYMRIAGFAAEGLRSERRIHDSFPSKELQDYWGTRPRYEDEAEPGHGASASGSSSSVRSSAYGSGSGSGSTATANPTPAPAQTENPEEETEAAREARRQFDIWAEEQRQKDLEKEGMPPPAYTLEDEGPAVVEPAAAQQQQPIQQQRPVQPVQQQQPAQSQQPQQHQQTRPVQQQGQQNYSNSRPASLTPGGSAQAVDALASEFAARAHMASPPPLHPSHPGRHPSASASASGSGQGYGRGANLGQERPPLHPLQQRVGSQGSSSGHSYSGGSAGGVDPGRVASPEQLQGQGGRPYQQQQAQYTGEGASYGAQSPYQQQQQGVAGGVGQGQGPQQSQPGYQQPQRTDTGGSNYRPAYPPRPTSAHPGQGQGAGYAPPAGAPPGQGRQGGHAPPSGAPPGQGQGQGGYTPPSGPPQAGYAPPAGPPQGQTGYAPPAGSPHGQGQTVYATPASPPPGQAGYTPPQSQTPYAAQGPHQQYAQAQSPQHTSGSSSAPHPASPHQQYHPQQAQHTGGSGSSSYAPSHAPHQQHVSPQTTGSSQHAYQRPQHTGGSSYAPPQAPRPSSTYPGQAAGGYTPPAGPPPQGHAPGSASGSGLGHSSSLSARPTSMYPGAASPPQGLAPRPDSAAPRPTTPGYASYPGPGGGGPTYPASPPPHGHPPSLAPRHDSMRPTTPGYAGQPGAPRPGPGPMGPSQAPYSNQFPSPELSGPAFPSGPAAPYGAYQTPTSPHEQSFPGQAFPTPQQPGSSGYPASPPPLGNPSYPPAGPSFPNTGPSFPDAGGFYQQPFPGAGFPGQSPYNNYSQQWGPNSPPPMHQQPYGQQQPYGGPNFPMASPPPSGALGSLGPSLDKLVGRQTREQLENTVGNLAQSSTKLLNKFR